MRRALDRISRVASHLTSTGIMSGSASTVTSPAWRQAVLTALKKNGKHMPYVKYFQMATVKPNGSTANRPVDNLGFLGDTADMEKTKSKASKITRPGPPKRRCTRKTKSEPKASLKRGKP